MTTRSLVSLSLTLVCLALGGIAGARTVAGQPVTYLDTGLSQQDHQHFFRDGLGNRALPEAWFRALEDPAGDRLLGDRDNMKAVGFLYEADDDLPIGLARNEGPGGAWLGVNCAHCHTTDLTYKGTTVRIVGGTSKFDTNQFYGKVFGAIVRTSRDESVFNAFADRLLGAKATAPARAQLRGAIKQAAAGIAPFVDSFAALHPIQSGPRFAFNDIFMNVGASMLDPRNVRPERGYAGMRSIWDMGKFQWEHFDSQIGSGVSRIAFGFSVFDAFYSPTKLETVNWNVENVHRSAIEIVNKLHAPAWPERILGRIDRARAERGKKTYRSHCAGCHEPVASEQMNGLLVANVFPYKQVGTDPLYIESQYDRDPKTGELLPRQVFTGPLAGTLFADEAGRPRKSVDFVTVYLPKISQAILEARYRVLGIDPKKARAAVEDGRPNVYRRTLSHTAKPLRGIWATAPYLHNDSVPNLYQLLLPASQRAERFRVGGDFDPAQVGYHPDAEVGFQLDTTIDGNRNVGHEGPRYGTRLEEEARLDLLEYLKTL